MAFEYGKRITIDSSKVDTALANYPVQVKLTDENFDFSLCKADGSDIRFFDLEDNALKFERVEHVKSEPAGLREGEIDILTGWTKSSASGVVSSTTSVLDVRTVNTHNQQRIYKDTGASNGAIAIDHYYKDGTGSYKTSNRHVIFRVRSSTITSGAHYNQDTYSGWGIYMNWGGTSTIDFMEFNGSNRANGYETTNVQKKVLCSSASGQTISFKISWDSEKVFIEVDGTLHTINLLTIARKDATICEMGYAMYDGYVTFTSKSFQMEMPAVPGSGVYNVSVPSISNTKNTEFVLRCGDSTLYNTSIEAWQDQTGKQLTYVGSAKLEKVLGSTTKWKVPEGVTKVDVLVVGGGGGGGMDMGGGGGGGEVLYAPAHTVTPGSEIDIVLGRGGAGAPAAGTDGQPGAHQYTISAKAGQSSKFGSLEAIGGGYGGSSYFNYGPNNGYGGSGASGGGASGYSNGSAGRGGSGTTGKGFNGGNSSGAYYSGGGGGAGGVGISGSAVPHGGPGLQYSEISPYYFGGGGGGSAYSRAPGGNGGIGGGGGGAIGVTTGGLGYKDGKPGGGGGINSHANMPGGDAGANTGGGGGGGSHYNANNKGGDGGSGIVILKYVKDSVETTTIFDDGAVPTTSYARISGAGSYFTIPNPEDFQFGTGDFTIEWSEYKRVNTGAMAIWHQWSGSGDRGFLIGYDGTLCYAGVDGANWNLLSAFRYGNNTLNNQWVDRALIRKSGVLYGYENGVLYAQIPMAAAPFFNSAQPVIIGAYANGGARTSMNGDLGGMRITKGRARYTAEYTPPSKFEIDGDDVVFCTNFDTIYIADEMPLPHEWVMVSNLAILYSYKVNWLNDYLNKYDTRPLNSIQLNVSSLDGYSEDFILTKEMDWSGEFEIQDKEGLSFNFESLPNYTSASSIANSRIELNNSLLTTTYTTSGVTWKDNNDEYAARPSNFDIDLNLNGKFFERKLTSTGVEVFTNLPLMDRLGRQFAYSSEVPNKIDGYVVENGNVLRKAVELSLGMFNGVLLNNWRTIHRIYKGEFRVVQGKMWLLNGPPLTAIPEIQYGWNDSASWDDLGVWTEFIGRFSTFYEIGLNKDEEGTLFSNYKLLNNDVLYK